MVAAGGASALTYKIAKDAHKLEKSFNRLSTIFDSLICAACEVSESSLQVHSQLEILATCIDDAEQCQRQHETVMSVRSSLDRLSTKFGESRSISSRCHEILKKKRKQLKQAIWLHDLPYS